MADYAIFFKGIQNRFTRILKTKTPHTVSDAKSLKTEYQAYLPMLYSNRGYKVFQVKYSAYTECEIIPCGNCEIEKRPCHSTRSLVQKSWFSLFPYGHILPCLQVIQQASFMPCGSLFCKSAKASTHRWSVPLP